MKRKFTSYLFVSAVLAAGTAGGIQVFGQSGRDQYRPQNSGQNNSQNTREIINEYRRDAAPQSPGTPMINPPVGPSVPGQSWPPVHGPQSFTSWPPVHGPQSFTIVTKEGTVERINKEAGVQLSKEEFDQVNETRRKIQNAVTQIRSPDVDEAKRKDAKELIAKYLKVEFQADQDSRREQVERLEKQVEQLKKQLSKREESQDKLIELRMQLLENDASGLSFPDSWGNLSGPPQAHLYVPPYPGSYGMTQPSGNPYQHYFSPIPNAQPQVFSAPMPSYPKLAPAVIGPQYIGR